MEYKKIDNGSYNIHIIKTNKFKNVKVEVFFRNEVEDDLTKRSFLFDLLCHSTKQYNTYRKLSLKCEDLYKAYVYASTYKEGNMIINSISLDFLNPLYTEEDYYEDAIKLVFDVIFEPNIDNNEFDSQSFNVVKEKILTTLKSEKENPSVIAIKEMFKSLNSKTSYFLLNEDDLACINTSNLVDEYKKVIKHDYIDIFVVGDVDIDKTIEFINKYSKFDTIKTHQFDAYIYNKKRKKPTIKIDKGNYAQTQICTLLNYNNLTDYEKRYSAHIYNIILGGYSLDSRLCKVIREENSLCYNINSVFRRFDNIGYIMTSVAHENLNKTIKLIKNVIKNMSSITEEELEYAKQSTLNNLRMVEDNPERIIDSYLFNDIGYFDTYETRIEKFKNVSMEDVLKVSKKVSVDYIYVLGGNENGKN